MWDFKVEQPGDAGVLTLDEELTIQRATELRTMLMDSIDSVNHVQLDLEKVNGVDLACLQLLCSAHLTVAKTNKRLTVQNGSRSLEQAVMASGFSNVKDCVLQCEDNCLEIKGGN